LVRATGNGAVIRTRSIVSFAADRTVPNQNGHVNAFLMGDWTVSPSATLNMDGPIGTNTLVGSTPTNEGTVQGFGFDAVATTIINNGTFTLGVFGDGRSTFVNNGTVRSSVSGGTLGFFGLNFQNMPSGTVQVLGGGTVTLSGPLVNQGRLTGVETLSNTSGLGLASITNGGIVSPGVLGGGAGTLNLNANFTQSRQSAGR
jgi:hypothetical protein